MNEIKELFNKNKGNRPVTEQIHSLISNFHFDNNQKRLDVVRGELTEKEYKKWRKSKINEIKLEYSTYLFEELEFARETLSKAEKEYQEKRAKDTNILAYQRMLDKLNSLTPEELLNELHRYIGDKSYILSEDELLILKTRISNSDIDARTQKLFFNKIDEKKNLEPWRYENKTGMQGHALEQEYASEYYDFDGKTIKIKDENGRTNKIFFKDLFSDEDISLAIEDVKSEMMENRYE